MRRLIAFLACLTVALLVGVSTAQADGLPLRRPQPAQLKARAVAEVGAPGALVPVEGTLLDAQRRPLTGVPVLASVAGAAEHGALESLTGSGGAFELYVPLPSELPASGIVDLTVSFGGTAEAAASSLTLPIRVVPQDETNADQPDAEPAPEVANRADITALPTSGSALIDQLILVAAGLFGVMVLLFGIGAFLRRRH